MPNPIEELIFNEKPVHADNEPETNNFLEELATMKTIEPLKREQVIDSSNRLLPSLSLNENGISAEVLGNAIWQVFGGHAVNRDALTVPSAIGKLAKEIPSRLGDGAITPISPISINDKELIIDKITGKVYVEPSQDSILLDIKLSGQTLLEQKIKDIKNGGTEFKESESEIQKHVQSAVDKIKAASNVAEMIAKGDLGELSKLMKSHDGTPVDMKLVAKILKDAGLNLVVEIKQDKLLISHPGDDAAVMIDTAGNADLVGITGRKYDFNATFVGAEPEKELKEIVRRAARKEIEIQKSDLNYRYDSQTQFPGQRQPVSNSDIWKQ